MRPTGRDLVPAGVRDAHVAPQPTHVAADQTQAGRSGVLLAVVEEELHPDAEAEQRDAAVVRDADHRVEAEAAEDVFGHPEHAAELDAIDLVHRHQHVPQAHAAGGGLLEDLHVLVARQADEVRDGLAHVRHRQRRALTCLHEAEDERIRDRLAFLLNVHRSDYRRRGLGNRRGSAFQDLAGEFSQFAGSL